ncbi:hypothetical protein QP860_09730 [Aerococcus sp. UMB1112A]|uniref:hypothetical protein n=1 Tax=unclassified Aerococcus TaxID=2618060 RepID=UPI0008A3822C|nr:MULTISPECIES: hypothetical protein [unclassified Aerococcus]KAB0645251.1 hypothetical protein F6I01_11975 [Aerococcus sanguinicola]MDK6856387.1 hypothetical protein [Aerococcus sp. UMB7533]MDK8503303.1 hypothetical protein [Aerococcus sp. UMB1112A]OFN05348.1 hypothetical protein HMPREF2626_03510 [Aerococcus sp. HMSC062A02]OHO42769.1 hypothetical protein HMPREF2705_02585 [Aerococcus sp. HMSC035B07]
MTGKISLVLLASLALSACAGSSIDQEEASTASESEPKQDVSSVAEAQVSSDSSSERSSQASSSETQTPAKREQPPATQDNRAHYQAEEYQESNEYPGYTNKEVEMVRVYLSVMNNTDLFPYGNDGDHIDASFIPAGTIVDPYAPELSPVWPTDAWNIAMGKTTAGSSIFQYTSNYDGTVTVYRLPYHWHGTPESESARAQEALDNGFILPVEPYTPSQVQPLLDTLQIWDE